MKVKDLRTILKGLPAEMEVVFNSGLETDLGVQGTLVIPLRKGKKKLTKSVKGYQYVQSRPHKDENATLKLVLE